MKRSKPAGATFVEVIIYTALFAFLSITLTGTAYLVQTTGQRLSFVSDRAAGARTVRAAIARALSDGAQVLEPMAGGTLERLTITRMDGPNVVFSLSDGVITRTEAGISEPLHTDAFSAQWQVTALGASGPHQSIAYEIIFSPRNGNERQSPVKYRGALPIAR